LATAKEAAVPVIIMQAPEAMNSAAAEPEVIEREQQKRERRVQATVGGLGVRVNVS
jgi:hypothetical protein